jgi:hypothetical protein
MMYLGPHPNMLPSCLCSLCTSRQAGKQASRQAGKQASRVTVKVFLPNIRVLSNFLFCCFGLRSDHFDGPYFCTTSSIDSYCLACMNDPHLPAIGTRFSLGSSRGTIRYVGEVPPTKGIWIGVEWDDASRGKHSGTRDNVCYFTCR